MSARGLIFDVDGVVVDSEPVNAEASIAVFAEHFDLPGVVREDFRKGIGRGAAAYMRAAAAEHGRELDDDQVARAVALREAAILELIRRDGLPVFPGVLELARAALADDGWGLAIATSASVELAEAMLDAAGMPYRDAVFVNGSMVRKKKPDPELFLKAIDSLAIPATACAVIEDAPDGVAAAKAAGAHCVAITNSVDAEALAAADRVVDSLAEIGLDDLAALLDVRA